MRQYCSQIEMFCPYSKQHEKIHIDYISEGNDLIIVRANGCDKNYHRSEKCIECTQQAKKNFTEAFEKH